MFRYHLFKLKAKVFLNISKMQIINLIKEIILHQVWMYILVRIYKINIKKHLNNHFQVKFNKIILINGQKF